MTRQSMRHITKHCTVRRTAARECQRWFRNMKTKELGVIAVKITGIACLIVALFKQQHVLLLLVNYSMMREAMAGSGIVVLVSIFSLAIMVLVGLGLLFAGDRLGHFITRDETDVLFSEDGKTILQIGVAIIGVWVMAIAIPRVIEKISFVFLLNNAGVNTARDSIRMRYVPELIAASVQSLIGIWMFFGNRGIIGIRNVARNAGHRRRENQQSLGT